MQSMSRFVLLGAAAWALACDSLSTSPLAPQSGDLVALRDDGSIFWVSPAKPDSLRGSVRMRGTLGTTDPLVTIAYRPATGALYGRSTAGGMFTLDAIAGLAAKVGPDVQLLGASVYASAFSPAADRWRIVTDAGDNVLMNPETGFGTGGTPIATTAVIGAIAYASTAPGLWTVYGIDNTNKQLVRLGGLDGVPSPNSGVIEIVGSLGLGSDTVSAGGFAVTAAGEAYAAIRLSSDDVTKLYRIDLGSGAATVVGRLGTGAAVRAMTFAP
jgi:hypothetical protein